MKSKIQALLVGSRVIVLDIEKARELFQRGFFGKFVGVDKVKPSEVSKVAKPLELSLLEALYLLDEGRIEVVNINGKALSRDELLEVGRKYIANFDLLYEVYRDLRSRGYVVRTGLKYGTYFAVYEKGPGIDHAPYLVHVLESGSKLEPLDIIRAGRLSHTVRKKFILAYRDKIYGKVNYLVLSWFTP